MVIDLKPLANHGRGEVGRNSLAPVTPCATASGFAGWRSTSERTWRLGWPITMRNGVPCATAGWTPRNGDATGLYNGTIKDDLTRHEVEDVAEHVQSYQPED